MTTLSPALFANMLTIILCLAVLVQSVRMMRGLKGVNVSQMGTVVLGLDHATAQARAVLNELKIILAREGADNARTVAEGEAIRDELKMLIEIADSMAQRLAEAPRPEAERSFAHKVESEAEDVPTEADIRYEPTPRESLDRIRALVAELNNTRRGVTASPSIEGRSEADRDTVLADLDERRRQRAA